jgi:hypothetical protein
MLDVEHGGRERTSEDHSPAGKRHALPIETDPAAKNEQKRSQQNDANSAK